MQLEIPADTISLEFQSHCIEGEFIICLLSKSGYAFLKYWQNILKAIPSISYSLSLSIYIFLKYIRMCVSISIYLYIYPSIGVYSLNTISMFLH